MVHKMKLAKGMQFVADKATLDAEREAVASMLFEEDFRIHSAVQNVYSGAVMSLISTSSGRWYVKFSSNDLATFGRDEKEARKYFMGFASVKGELI
jgi:hypothetical protein